MSSTPKICLIGDIVIDVSLKTQNTEAKLRLGGIVHAARCLWALNIPFSVGYFSPDYLDKQIVDYLNSLNCHSIYKLGKVIGAPYVFLIEDVKESGSQGYQFLLKEEIEINYNTESLTKIAELKFEDYFIISGNYDMPHLLQFINGKIHVDIANNVNDLDYFSKFENAFSTVFLSTSSTLFSGLYNDDFLGFASKFKKYSQKLILKENRGGSRGIDFSDGTVFNIASQTKPILHSVGIGDVYGATFVSYFRDYSFEETLNLSSWIASEYALTTHPDDFKLAVTRILKSDIKQLINIKGISLPWEIRKNINIYIAAPDFDFIDTTPIDNLVNALKYHNFSPRRPIKENGQMEKEATKVRKQELFTKDIILLEECSILIAVLLYNDPGTLIEIGLSSAKGIPTIVYDPYNLATNCMLTELPDLISSELDDIISEVFIKSSKFI